MKLGLTQKILIAAAIIIMSFMLLLWFSNQSIKQLTDDIEQSNQLSQLSQLSNLIVDNAKQYEQNAPRDYESYNRDLNVYYNRLQTYLTNISDLVDKSQDDFFNRKTIANFLINKKLLESNQKNFQELSNMHQNFTTKFWEQIGENKDEPRLEWGNNFILSGESMLFKHIQSTNQDFQLLVIEQRKATQQINKYSGLGLILMLILLIFWVNQSIVKRIIKVADACRAVAQGKFGLQIKDKGQDEITQLVKDFNHLSNQSNSILSVLNGLQAAKTKQQALDIIRQETQMMVNASSVILIKTDGTIQHIQSASPAKDKEILTGKQLAANDSCIDWDMDKLSHFTIADVLSHTMKFPNAHFAKYLLHQKNVNSMLVFSLNSENKNGVLIFCKKQKNGFSQQQTNSLLGIKSLFAGALL